MPKRKVPLTYRERSALHENQNRDIEFEEYACAMIAQCRLAKKTKAQERAKTISVQNKFDHEVNIFLPNL